MGYLAFEDQEVEVSNPIDDETARRIHDRLVDLTEEAFKSFDRAEMRSWIASYTEWLD